MSTTPPQLPPNTDVSSDTADGQQSLFDRFNDLTIFEKTGLVLAVVLVLFLLALVLSLSIGIFTGNSEDVAAIIAIVRDLFIILLAMQGMLITISLIVLILQLASLINLLQNEISPIVKNVQDTSNTIKGTTEFLSENIATPLIEGQAWLAGIATIVGELRGIRRNTKRKQPKQGEQDPTPTSTKVDQTRSDAEVAPTPTTKAPAAKVDDDKPSRRWRRGQSTDDASTGKMDRKDTPSSNDSKDASDDDKPAPP